MPAKLNIVTNQKGGAGKNTAAVQLAETKVRRGLQTLLIDAENQGPEKKWVYMAEHGQARKIRVQG